jgi:coenzyme F420-0:L-glutamate ligase/coenzyme F420-1:gamma-L-glutamate ligase
MLNQVTFTALSGVPLVEPGDNLAQIIADGVARSSVAIAAGDVFVVAQKIVSKAEDRYLALSDLVPSPQAISLASQVGKDPAYLQAVLSESTSIVRTAPNVVIVEHRLGFVMANAGIDESNIEQTGNGRVLLLPENPDATCDALKAELEKVYGVPLGIIINDSFGRPWRNGVVGVAVGSAGVPSLQDLIGTRDLFGREMRVTQIALADELASAASLVMGQAAESQPIVHVRGFKIDAPDKPASALVRARKGDLFR